MNKRHPRRVLRAAHRWLGLVVGLAFILLGLTGSLLVFHREIDHFLLNRDWWRVERAAPSLTLAELALRLREQRPSAKGVGVDRPAFSGSAPSGYYEVPGASGETRFMIAALDPATGRIRGEYAWGVLPPGRRNFMSVVYRLHYELLAGATGLTLVGVLGLATLLLLAIGLYLWWPRPRRWRQSLRLKPGAPPVRRQFDLHGIFGALGGLGLGIIALSGAYMALPGPFRAAIGAVTHLTPFPQTPHITALTAAPPARVEAAIRPSLEHARYDSFALGDAGQPHRLTFREPGDPRTDYGSTIIFADPADGHVLAHHSPARVSTADLVLRFQFPLHNGQALGQAGRILVAVLGILPIGLFVTGLRLWWLRRSARSRASKAPQRATA
jgi:uncharacterized iron-regulated membrane protein